MFGANLTFGMRWWGSYSSHSGMEISISLGIGLVNTLEIGLRNGLRISSVMFQEMVWGIGL